MEDLLYFKLNFKFSILIMFIFIFKLALIRDASGFNINTRRPKIYQQSTDSGFGFSVAQYSINGSKSIIVGAPFELGTGGSRDGAVYRCQDERCDVMNFDKTFEVNTHAREGFLGGAVTAATDGLIVACAPRAQYHKQGDGVYEKDEIYMIGACFIYDGSQDQYLRPFTPCRPGSFGVTTKQLTCAAGFSVCSMQSKSSFVIGALGSNSYRGEFIRMEKTRRKGPDYGLRGLEEFDYLGYAVVSGHFTGQTELDVVAGSPRSAEHLGQVQLFRRKPDGSGGWEPIGEIVYGQQFGSYFGSVLAVGDFNGDGLDDLAIGAPFYTDLRTKTANMGKVHVLYQTRESNRIFQTHNTTLVGTSSAGGRFGSALAALTDINQDGYDDLAVGEPLGGEDGKGVVLIYHGSASGIQHRPTQVIQSSDFSGDLQGFGSALSGNIDMDDNGYPDIVIGAQTSGSAVLLSSHPVLNVSVELAVEPTMIELENLNCHTDLYPQSVSCVKVTTVVVYDGKSVPNRIDLTFTWEFDVNNSTENLAFFVKDNRKNNSISEQFGLVKQQTVTVEQTVFFSREIVSYMKPVGILFSYNLQDPPESVQDPVLNKTAPDYTTGEVEIYRSPADVELSVSSLVKLVVLAKDELVQFEIEVENLANVPCYRIAMIVEPPTGITYARIDSPNKVTCFLLEDDSETTVCNLGFILDPESKIRFSLYMTIDKPALLFNTTDLYFKFNLTSANDMNSDNDAADITLPLTVDSKIQVTGASDPDQIQIVDKNVTVTHVIQLNNVGRSPLKSSDIWIRWPVMTSEGVPLFTSVDGPMVTENRGRCHTEEHFMAPLEINSLEPCQADVPEILCRTFHCETDMMGKGEIIVVNMTGTVLPEITVLSDQDNTVTLTSVAKVKGQHILDGSPGMVEDITSVSTNVVFPGVERKGETVALWIILVAVFCGVTLLLILVIVFWKVGFFKRKTRDDLYSAKRTSMNENWHDEDPRDRIGSAADDPEEQDDNTMNDNIASKDKLMIDVNENQ